MSSRLTTDEMAYIVEDCGARAFVTSAYKADQAAEIASLVGDDVALYMIDGAIDGYDSCEDAVDAQPADPPARGPGRGPRHALLVGHHRPPQGREGAAARRRLSAPPTRSTCWSPPLFGATADSVYLSPAPLYHAAPLRFCMAVPPGRRHGVVMEHFDPAEALALIERHRVTHSQWVPTMFIRMLKLPDEVRESLRRVVAPGRHPRRRAVPGRRSSSR